jgi:hypothetical protein
VSFANDIASAICITLGARLRSSELGLAGERFHNRVLGGMTGRGTRLFSSLSNSSFVYLTERVMCRPLEGSECTSAFTARNGVGRRLPEMLSIDIARIDTKYMTTCHFEFTIYSSRFQPASSRLST